MTIPLLLPDATGEPVLATIFLVIRVAFGLLVHGLRHPLQPASICRISGRVTVR